MCIVLLLDLSTAASSAHSPDTGYVSLFCDIESSGNIRDTISTISRILDTISTISRISRHDNNQGELIPTFGEISIWEKNWKIEGTKRC